MGAAIIITPDGDLYEEDYSDEAVFRDVRLLGDDGEIPLRLRTDGVAMYRFNGVTADADLSGLWGEARGLLQLSMIHQLVAGQGEGGGSGSTAIAETAVVGKMEEAAAWVLAEHVEGHKIGEIVPFPAGAAMDGDWGLTTLSGMAAPRPVLCRKLHHYGSEIAAFCEQRVKAARETLAVAGEDTAVGDDVRTLSVKYGPDGSRRRNFRESVEEMVVQDFEDFLLEGPRTVMWLMTETAKHAEGPRAQHLQWVSQSRVPEGDRAIHEDKMLAHAMEVAITYDSLNISNLASFEILARRRQLLAEAHVQNPSAPNYEGSMHFMGDGVRPGGALVAPALTQHVAEKLRVEASISKEKRKAAEARSLAPKSKAKGGGKGEPAAVPS